MKKMLLIRSLISFRKNDFISKILYEFYPHMPTYIRKIVFIISLIILAISTNAQSSYLQVFPLGLNVQNEKLGFYSNLFEYHNNLFYVSTLNTTLAKDIQLDFFNAGLSLPFVSKENFGLLKMDGGFGLSHFWKDFMSVDYNVTQPHFSNIPARIYLNYNSKSNVINLSLGYQKTLYFFDNEFTSLSSNTDYYKSTYDGFFIRLTLNWYPIFDNDGYSNSYNYNGTFWNKINLSKPKRDISPKQSVPKTELTKEPLLEISEVSLSDENGNKTIESNEKIELKVKIANKGNKDAENVIIQLEELSDSKGLIFEKSNYQEIIKINSSKTANIKIRSDDNLETHLITFRIIVYEGVKKFNSFEISIPAQKTAVNKIQLGTVSDIDVDIPVVNGNNDRTFALVVGNEDYSSRQPNLTKESNVPFAINDAKIFAEYLEKTLCIPKKNISLMFNSTTSEIFQGLNKLRLISNVTEGQAKLIFYYAGHGLPDEKTKVQYLIPVDVSGTNIEYGIRLDSVVKILTTFPNQQVTLILDACFSGGARNQSLLSSRGIKITPKETNLKNKTVLFASSTGSENSNAFPEQNHGMFTYFLLKKIKETKGNISYKELIDYITKQVQLNSVLINNSLQTPTVQFSFDLNDKWDKLNLK